MSKRIALIGLDGSGKSANIERMQHDKAYAEYQFVWVRWKPTLLKPAYLLMQKRIAKKQKNTNTPSDEKTEERKELNADYTAKAGLKGKIFANPAIRCIWMFLATIDYFFQFYLRVCGLLVKKKNIIFDRYFLDLFVDQGINFGYTPERIHKEIHKNSFLFPRIDDCVYIRVSPETCYKRKDDIPNMDYLNKRYKIYEYMAQKDGWLIVDGELPFEEVNARIKQLILG